MNVEKLNDNYYGGFTPLSIKKVNNHNSNFNECYC